MDEDEDCDQLYGTPLPDYEDESTLRKKAAREQEVCDEKGRRRFHGAFTGGFSAGYFNTVGTKEGWTPSSFVSSKNKTAERIRQNPEDFMDDEDFGEFGIATKRIHATTDFQNSAEDNKGKRKFGTSDAVIPGEAPLKELVQPLKESIGIMILKKLGWRQGQGIGPRIKKQSTTAKTYGCSPFPQDITTEEDDPTMLMFTFAPDDTDSVSYEPKDNCFGLGYTGLSKKSVLDAPIDLFSPTSTSSFLKKDKKKLRITGQAFGVGAYEDDDEDIYSKDDMSQYDFSDISVPIKDKSKSKIGSGRLDKSASDVLEGFCLALKPAVTKKQYNAPVLPQNFRPIHISKANLQQAPKPTRGLSADCRSLIIGESKFRTIDNRPVEKPATLMLNLSNKFTSSGFIPFSNDKAKQNRYDQFLKMKNTPETQRLEKPTSMTEWEHQQELEEFSKAATFFKPLSFVLSSRFESRSQLDVEHEVMSALQKIKSENTEKTEIVEKRSVGSCSRKIFEWHPTSLLCKRFNVPNPYPNSDSSGVPHSQKIKKTLFDHLSSDSTGKREEPKNVTVPDQQLEYKVEVNTQNQTSEIPPKDGSSNSVIRNSTENLPSERTRPPMDLFKDIFENSSSEDEEPSQNEEKPSEIPDVSILSSSPSNIDKKLGVTVAISEKDCDTPKPPTVPKKIGFGVFANLDLDALSKRTPINKMAWQSHTNSENSSKVESFSEDKNNSMFEVNNKDKESDKTVDDNYYGPELPPNYSDSCSSQSKKDKKKHNKHKSKHKHKHHKHKSVKRKKKKQLRKDSDSDDSSDSEDIPPSLIIEKLKKLKKV